MKKIILFIVLILSYSIIFAQKGKVTNAQNLKDSGKLDKALETIETAVDSSNPKAEKSIPWSKTWEVRGEIYRAIFQSEDANIKKLSDDPLTVALDSYKKALELDEKNKFRKSLKIKLTLLTADLSNQAAHAFHDEDFAKSLRTFEQILEVQEIDIIKADNPEAIDTVILFNAGLAAYNAGNYNKAIKYYGEAVKVGYNGARTYYQIARSYQQKGDTLSSLEILKGAFLKYPEDNDIVTNMVSIYMQYDKTDEAMKYLELAIEQDPKNITYYWAQGSLYEKLGEEAAAIKSYEKAIEVDDTFFNSYYNLGVLYFNKGVAQVDVAGEIPANENEKYEAEVKKSDVWFEKALPFMEKCNELQPDESGTLESLKTLYYRLKQMDKYNVVLEKLGQ